MDIKWAIDNVKIKTFTDLRAWQHGHALVLDVYRITDTFPRKEIYSITDQMRRAAVSITSNIAEGFGRRGYKEKIQFYFLAVGSLNELKNLILIAKDIGYLDHAAIQKLGNTANDTHKLLNGLIKKSRSLVS